MLSVIRIHWKRTSMDCTSCLTSPSSILGWLESENTAEAHTAVWESVLHPQALWTHTNRFIDNDVFIRARKNQSKWPHSYPQPPSDRAQRHPLLQYEPLQQCYRVPSVSPLRDICSNSAPTFTPSQTRGVFHHLLAPTLLFNILKINICILLLSLPFMLYSTV